VVLPKQKKLNGLALLYNIVVILKLIAIYSREMFCLSLNKSLATIQIMEVFQLEVLD